MAAVALRALGSGGRQACLLLLGNISAGSVAVTSLPSQPPFCWLIIVLLAWIVNDVCVLGVSAGAGCGSCGVLAAGQRRACVLEPDPVAIKNALLSCFF